MKMCFKIVSSLTFFLLLAAAPGFAQADLKATVPFDFYAGETPLPAGLYALDVDNAGLVWISRSDAGARCIVGSIPIGGGPNDGRASKLVFHRYGNEYFLTEMWASGQRIGRMFRRTPHEDEVALNAARGQVTLLAGRR
jgi:hypothetical protein